MALIPGLVPGLGQVRAALQIQMPPLVALGTWTPSRGDLQTQFDFCVLSTRGNSPRSNPTDYAVQLDQPGAGATFYLANWRFRALPVTIEFEDLINQQIEVLAPGIFSDLDKTGARRGGRGCLPTDNAQLNIRIPAAELATARSGIYSAFFRLSGRNDRGNVDDDRLLAILRVPAVIQVSGLDDIDLGHYTGGGAIEAEETFCVFTTHRLPLYRYEISSSVPGTDFLLSNGSDVLPYSVSYNDGRGYRQVRPGARRSLARNANQQAPDCRGQPNAALRVRLEEADLAGRQPGTYNGTITITVAPL